MLNAGGLAMHQALSPDHLSTEGDCQRLMAEADTEKGQAPGEMRDRFDGNAGFIGRARARRNDDACRLQRLDVLDRDLIVAIDADVLALFPEILNEIVGKRVVIVDHEQHGTPPRLTRYSNPCSANSIAFIIALALLQVSSY